jgi:hypothetical protein
MYAQNAQKTIRGGMSFNDQKMTKTQPNCIIIYIFGFSVKRSSQLA